MGDVDVRYLVGLAIFSVTVIGYTMVGGFLASVWTDMFQSLLMALGVVLLFVLVVPAASQAGFSAPTLDAVQVTAPEFASGPGFSTPGRSVPAANAGTFVFCRLGFRRSGNSGRHDPGDGRQRHAARCAARSFCWRFTIC